VQAQYASSGLRRTVKAILVVNIHNHPHVLVTSDANGFLDLPGGRLRANETEIEGLTRKLTNRMNPLDPSLAVQWQVGECLGVFWRPNFEKLVFPYLPPHVTRPKEVIKIFMVALPETCHFQVPENWSIRAVPFFQLYDNAHEYGPILSALPNLISRLHLTLTTENTGTEAKEEE